MHTPPLKKSSPFNQFPSSLISTSYTNTMGKTRTISKKKNGGFVKLKIVVKRLQKCLILGKKSSSPEIDEMAVPEVVKEGHFAVIAVDDDELKRFIVPLNFLTYPSFLRLLDQAAEEYGFDHDGALTVPCRPSELERILAEQWAADGGGSGESDWWSSYWSGVAN